MGRFREADLRQLHVGSVAARPTRVRVEEFAKPLPVAAAQALLDSLPDQLAARALREAFLTAPGGPWWPCAAATW